ncbi:MAG: hypothetical protein ACYCS1_05410 [Gammaproteobacteria bacterium]
MKKCIDCNYKTNDNKLLLKHQVKYEHKINKEALSEVIDSLMNDKQNMKNIKKMMLTDLDIVEELRGYDLEIKEYSRIEEGNEFENLTFSKIISSYYVQTIEDISVGIYGVAISPEFNNYDEIKSWWNLIKSIIDN